MAKIGPIIGGGLALYVLGRMLGGSSRSPETATSEPGLQFVTLIWPIEERLIKRYGDTVTDKRPGSGRPHKGIDIFADARTLVRASQGGIVLRVTDGRKSDKESTKAAGLWADIEGSDRLVYRYLHLGNSFVRAGDKIKQGTPIGSIAEPHSSGLGDNPHLHFEMRSGDYTSLRDDYGIPIDPLTRLPPLRRNA